MSSISVRHSLPSLWLLSKVPGTLEHKVALSVHHFSPDRFSDALAHIHNRSIALEARYRAGRISCTAYTRRAAQLDRLRFVLYTPYAGAGPRQKGLRSFRYQQQLGVTRAKIRRALALHPGTPQHDYARQKAVQSIAMRQRDLARAWQRGTLPKRSLYERIAELADLKCELHGWPASHDQATRARIFEVITALTDARTGTASRVPTTATAPVPMPDTGRVLSTGMVTRM